VAGGIRQGVAWLAAAVAVASMGGCIPRGALGPARLQPPAAAQKAGVRVGSGLLRQSVFVQVPSLGVVTGIVEGELDPAPGREIGLAGTNGAVFVDQTGKQKAKVSFSNPGVRRSNFGVQVDIIDVEGDGVCEFMSRGAWVRPAYLMDHQGKVLWTYGGFPGVDDMGAGDVNGDGRLEFGVGFNGDGGVHLLDSHGKKQWQQPDGNAWHVELVDTNRDGRAEVVNSNAGGEITVRDATGAVVGQGQPPGYFAHFSICRWPTAKDQQYALLAGDGAIWVLRFDGSVAKKLDAPQASTLSIARGVPVVLAPDGSTYFATAVAALPSQASVLYVHDKAGNLVYQEALAEPCASIAAVRLGDAKTDALLVGGDGKVFKYELAAAPGAQSRTGEQSPATQK